MIFVRHFLSNSLKPFLIRSEWSLPKQRVIPNMELFDRQYCSRSARVGSMLFRHCVFRSSIDTHSAPTRPSHSVTRTCFKVSLFMLFGNPITSKSRNSWNSWNSQSLAGISRKSLFKT
ncbi:hypothetical protein MT418_8505 [Batrachochytrium dendrobatidis]